MPWTDFARGVNYSLTVPEKTGKLSIKLILKSVSYWGVCLKSLKAICKLSKTATVEYFTKFNNKILNYKTIIFQDKTPYISLYIYTQSCKQYALLVTTLGLWQLMRLGTEYTVTRTWCTWAHDNWEGTLFSWLHIYYAYLASVRFEHSVCRGSLMITYVPVKQKNGTKWKIKIKNTPFKLHHIHQCRGVLRFLQK